MKLVHLLKIANWKLKIVLQIIVLIFAFCIIAPTARAGLITHAPNYLSIANGLVGSWSFDGPDISGNTAYDRSGQGNNGTLTNGPQRTIGRIGQALEFDGVNDLVSVAAASSINDLGPMSISAWIYPKSMGEASNGHIVAKPASGAAGNGRWAFMFLSGNGIRFWKGYTNLVLKRESATGAITLNRWNHVMMTWDGSTTAANVFIYVDGALVIFGLTTNGDGATISDSADNLYIGNNSGGSRTFDGLIDDVRIYNRALSANEIKRLYKIGR